MSKNGILAIGNFNSHITQVNIEGLSKEDIEQLCLKLINEKMIILRNDAAEVLRRQVEEFVESFYQRLACIAKSQDVVNRLKTPAVQFAIDESLLIYSKHPSLEEKELQVELLIDKIQTDNNTTKGIIIDSARLELCNLTNAQISMLAFLIICNKVFNSNNWNELFAFFQEIGSLLKDIQSMERVDYAYLQNTNCLHRISFVDKADFIEKKLYNSYAERTGHSTVEEFKIYLNTTNPLWRTILDRIKDNSMACYKPTAVGFYIGLKRLNKVFGCELDFDELYDAE